jgi:hypothetical protein
MCKKCWAIVAVLVIMVVGMFMKFVIIGETEKHPDGRTAIILTEDERNIVLTEMRVFLMSVQQITQGILDKDMAAVTKSARHVGAAAQGEVPGSLIKKLPIEFKKLGFDTHSKFDQLALDAEQLGDEEYALTQLSKLMQNCVSCHSAYRFVVNE